MFPEDWSPDGSVVALTGLTPGAGASIMLFSTEDNVVTSYLSAGNEERSPRFSPDGRWLVYMSEESGQQEIYVQAFPNAGGKWQASTDGGILPVWRADGKELFYISPDGLMAVTVESDDGFRTGTPVRLFGFDPAVTTEGYYPYDVAEDGQQFILVVPVEDQAAGDATVTLLQGWRMLLNR